MSIAEPNRDAFEVRALSPTFGAEISGVDLAANRKMLGLA